MPERGTTKLPGKKIPMYRVRDLVYMCTAGTPTMRNVLQSKNRRINEASSLLDDPRTTSLQLKQKDVLMIVIRKQRLSRTCRIVRESTFPDPPAKHARMSTLDVQYHSPV